MEKMVSFPLKNSIVLSPILDCHWLTKKVPLLIHFQTMIFLIGGLFMNKQNDEKIREVFKAVLMKIGKKILEGRIFDLMRISKPIQICYPLSFLEAIAKYPFSYVFILIYFKK